MLHTVECSEPGMGPATARDDRRRAAINRKDAQLSWPRRSAPDPTGMVHRLPSPRRPRSRGGGRIDNNYVAEDRVGIHRSKSEQCGARAAPQRLESERRSRDADAQYGRIQAVRSTRGGRPDARDRGGKGALSATPGVRDAETMSRHKHILA